jgi:TIR domain
MDRNVIQVARFGDGAAFDCVSGRSNDALIEVEGRSKAKAFISYSRKDMAFADRLEAVLKARSFEPLIDRTEIYAFEEWWKRIEALITSADTVVFVLSPDAVVSDVALREVAFAASLNKRFAPVGCRRVDDNAVPEQLAKLNFIFFDDEAQFEYRADQLAEALNTDISWIRQHTEFGEAARRWGAAEGPSGLLLRSPVLEQAEPDGHAVHLHVNSITSSARASSVGGEYRCRAPTAAGVDAGTIPRGPWPHIHVFVP